MNITRLDSEWDDIEKENDEFLTLLGNQTSHLDSMELIKNGTLKSLYADIIQIGNNKVVKNNEEIEKNEKDIKNKLTIYYISVLVYCLNEVSLYYDLELENSLINMGFSKIELQWLITFVDILKELNKINYSGKWIVSLSKTFKVINLYQYAKIYLMVLNKYKLRSSQSDIIMDESRLFELFRNVERNRDNREKAKKKINAKKKEDKLSLFETIWEELKNKHTAIHNDISCLKSQKINVQYISFHNTNSEFSIIIGN